ncbi:Uu.00g048740.m01.CDS01 [Anthostomella pinea]|uniref:Uu.00g048740.m01.CDS01 n=1 Tax=Anthostomella pinea TaxID=933095 RepID=A0AAI8YEM3_9PEZI|nr:Uu.00g048740.m01.CDS01 [Anthostomella pinea]
MVFIHRLFLLCSCFLVAACLATYDGPGQYNYGVNARLRLRKRQYTQSFIVSSLPRIDGKPQLRVELRDLEKDEDKWNLYLLALSWMQYTDQESPFSWYQIAGIHGAPGLTWADVEPVPGSENTGYCTHVSILFPTWHRPYMALYEQTLYNIVQFIATLYPSDQLERIQKAADAFRMPYWDWAAAPPEGDSVLPLSVGGSPNVEVSGPNGVQVISNPLFSYTFKPFNSSTFPDAPYNTWNETKRAPHPETDPGALSNDSFVALALDNHLPSYQQRLYNLFANYPDYTNFSNEAWIPFGDPGTLDSIESLHDSVHTTGGGGWGHLAIIAYSAFDPLFFLHHANVDRIFAMWQVIHNGSYVVPTPAVYGSHTTSAGDIQDVDTPLTPFFSNETSFWTSDMARDHEVFGYTYAEVVNKNRTEVITAINRLYTTYSPVNMSINSSHTLSSRAGTTARDHRLAPDHSGPLKTKAARWNRHTSTHPPMDAVFIDNTYREWIANVQVNKHAMNTSFSIQIFLGEAPSDSSSWPMAKNLIGTLGVFANNGPHGGMQQGKVTGAIPLTSALMSAISGGEVASLRAGDMEPFLSTYLDLRVSLLDGTVVDATEVEGLRVSIVSSSVTAPTSDDKLAKWGAVETHFDLFA